MIVATSYFIFLFLNLFSVQNVLIFFFFLIYVLFIFGLLHSMWDLSSPTRDQTHTPCIGSRKS